MIFVLKVRTSYIFPLFLLFRNPINEFYNKDENQSATFSHVFTNDNDDWWLEPFVLLFGSLL